MGEIRESFLRCIDPDTGDVLIEGLDLVKDGRYQDEDGVWHDAPNLPTVEEARFYGLNSTPIRALVSCYQVWTDRQRRPLVPQPDREFPPVEFPKYH